MKVIVKEYKKTANYYRKYDKIIKGRDYSCGLVPFCNEEYNTDKYIISREDKDCIIIYDGELDPSPLSKDDLLFINDLGKQIKAHKVVRNTNNEYIIYTETLVYNLDDVIPDELKEELNIFLSYKSKDMDNYLSDYLTSGRQYFNQILNDYGCCVGNVTYEQDKSYKKFGYYINQHGCFESIENSDYVNLEEYYYEIKNHYKRFEIRERLVKNKYIEKYRIYGEIHAVRSIITKHFSTTMIETKHEFRKKKWYEKLF